MIVLLNLLTILLFIPAYILGHQFGIHWLQILPGILLLYYWPGHNFNSIIFYKREKIDWPARLALDITLSIALLSIISLVLMKRVTMSEDHLLIFVLSANILLSIAGLFFNRTDLMKLQFPVLKQIDKKWFLLIGIPLLFFGVRLALNPFIFEIDSLHYYASFQSMLATGKIDSVLFSGREAYPFYLMASHYIAGMGYIMFAKFFIPIVFYLTSLALILLQNGKKYTALSFLSYFLILSSPMLVIMNEGVRPETFSLALVFPVLVLSYLGVKKNNFSYILVSLLVSFSAFRFHEFGIVLVLSSLLGLLILTLMNFGLIRTFIRKNWLIVIAAIVPYLLLLKIYSALFTGFLGEGMTAGVSRLIMKSLAHLKWDWWFLADAVTIWGAKIGWPGYTSILYYLYHGIIPFLFCLILVIIIFKSNRSENRKIINLTASLPLFAFFLIFFSIAEILPRLGIVLLFDRCWPYISMAVVVFSIILLESAAKTIRYKKLIAVGLILTVFSGVIGATAGSTLMGAMVSPFEKSAIEAIKELPSGSLVVSSQRNHNLVQIYGNRDFLQIFPDMSTNNFSKSAYEAIVTTKELEVDSAINSLRISKSSKEWIAYNDRVFAEQNQGNEIDSIDEKLKILKEFVPESYTEISEKQNEVLNLPKKQIYFLYSFAKLDHGILNTRGWWKETNDAVDYEFFKSYESQVVSRDKNYILIKIN